MLKYLNSKTKAFVVFIFSLCSLGLFILSSLLATRICQSWSGLIIGLAMMAAATPFHCIGKKKQWGYLTSFIINSAASGFVVSAYYLENKITLDIYNLLIAVIPAVAIILLAYLMLQSFSKTKKVTVTVATIINGLVTICATVFWIMYKDIIFSFGFFSSLISLFYLCVFGITIDHDERSVLRDISFGSFGSLIIISVVVIFILSEGDLIDGLDIFDGKSKKSKKHKA